MGNIGSRAAYDVHTDIEPSVTGLNGSLQLSNLQIFKGISFFAPGKQIRFLFDSSAAYFARGEPTQLSARITWRDSEGNPFQTVIRHDLEIYRSLPWRVR